MLVHFNASGQAKPFEALQCRFGSAPPTRPEQHSSDSAICRTPAAHVAGARALLHRLDFEGELAAPVLPPTDRL